MNKSQELSAVLLFVIFIALISLSRSDSIVTVREGEVAKLEFPYPCDSSKVTIQRGNGAPFYNSAEPGDLNLHGYQLNRFSVDNNNCSLWVEIDSVMRHDEATYICIVYKDHVLIQLIRIRLNIDYSPGRVSCKPRDKFTVRDWVLLECEASVGSLAGEIICYQDAKRLPPYRLIQSGEILKQSLWAAAEYPVFCCSSIFDQPKDICECNDFSWDPSYTDNVLHPCPTTPTQGTTMKNQLRKTSKDDPFPNTVTTPLNSITTPNKVHLSPWLWGCVVASITLLACLVVILVLICLRCKWKCMLSNTESTEKKDEYTDTSELISKMGDSASPPQISEKESLWVEIPNTMQKWQSSWNRSFAGFQNIMPEQIQHKHTGVYGLRPE